jgi:hypothetical protein
MVLFRHISVRERWARYRPTAARLLAAGFLAVACFLLVLDSLA